MSPLCPPLVFSHAMLTTKVAAEVDEYFSRLADTLERISDMLPLCDVYAGLFPRHESLREAIRELHGAVASFINNASQVFSSGSHVLGKAARIDFDTEFEPHLSSIRRWADQAERRVGIAHMAEQQASRRELSNAVVELSRVKSELTGLKELIRSGERSISPIPIR